MCKKMNAYTVAVSPSGTDNNGIFVFTFNG